MMDLLPFIFDHAENLGVENALRELTLFVNYMSPPHHRRGQYGVSCDYAGFSFVTDVDRCVKNNKMAVLQLKPGLRIPAVMRGNCSALLCSANQLRISPH